MKFTKFLTLTLTEKKRSVCEDGIFLASYDLEEASCDIFSLSNFYVAILYRDKKTHITTITGHYFASETSEDSCLNQIASALFHRL